MACNCCLVQNSINPQQYLATHYGGTSDAGIPVYCKCNYTVIHCVWKNIGHFDLGLGFERGQGQKHKVKAKSLKAKATSLKAKARKFGLEAKV